MPKCEYVPCIVQGDFPPCRLCGKKCCIQHRELVRDPQNRPFGIAAECHYCFKKDAESKWEDAVC